MSTLVASNRFPASHTKQSSLAQAELTARFYVRELSDPRTIEPLVAWRRNLRKGPQFIVKYLYVKFLMNMRAGIDKEA